jgi:acetate---CoA ligase (ADP-forming)
MSLLEQASRARSLRRLFEPQSIAIVGATEGFDKAGGRVLTSLLDNEFKGAIHPVNPNRPTVKGLRAYSSLEAISGPVDLAIVCLAAGDVEAQVELACRLDVGSLVVLASGFAELDARGAAAQKRIGDLARRHGVALLGPNCLGLMNGTLGMMASPTVTMRGYRLLAGKMGFVSQSGAIATFWMDRMLGLGLGCSKWVTTGNEADVTVSDALQCLVEDDDTEIIGMYVEGLRESDVLRRAFSTAIERRKPIIVLRSGRSRAGAQAAVSHTGVLAGEDGLYTELFEQFGVCQVNSLSEMVDVSRVFLTQRPRPGKRACIISLSGGAGALMADAAEFAHFELPPLPEQLVVQLRQFFPDYVQLANPIDLTTQIIVDRRLFERTLDCVMKSGQFDTILTFMAGRTPELLSDVGAAMMKLLPQWQGNSAAIWQATTPEFVAGLEAAGILVFDEIPEAVSAMARAVKIADRWERPSPDAAIFGASAGEVRTLTEQASKIYLNSRGVLHFPEGVLVQTAAGTADALAGFDGPWVAKLQSARLTHKSGQGGIELNLTSVDAVRDCVARMLESARQRQLDCEGVLIERMERIQWEFIVGLRRDPVLGAYLLVGRGGVWVEVDPDVTQAFLPLSAERIEVLLRRLRGFALFEGYRGGAKVPLARLAQSIAILCRFFIEHENVAEIEINPLAVCRDERIVAIDASVYRYEHEPEPALAAGGG